ncbi:MAG: hypothetical protein Q7J10_04450 [Methanosarcinaceae archaeon]|nr:hypothetical protein [Methanosarcinaceae archaeon]
MVLETFIISLNDGVSPIEVENIVKTLGRVRAEITMIAKKSIIASFDSSYVDVIRKKNGVILVGGINFRGRKIRKVVKKES